MLTAAQTALFDANTSSPMVSLTAPNGMMDDWLAPLKSASKQAIYSTNPSFNRQVLIIASEARAISPGHPSFRPAIAQRMCLLKDEFNSGILHIWWVLVFAQYALDHQTQLGANALTF
jgi:hypothetical protein